MDVSKAETDHDLQQQLDKIEEPREEPDMPKVRTPIIEDPEEHEDHSDLNQPSPTTKFMLHQKLGLFQSEYSRNDEVSGSQTFDS